MHNVGLQNATVDFPLQHVGGVRSSLSFSFQLMLSTSYKSKILRSKLVKYSTQEGSTATVMNL